MDSNIWTIIVIFVEIAISRGKILDICLKSINTLFWKGHIHIKWMQLHVLILSYI